MIGDLEQRGVVAVYHGSAVGCHEPWCEYVVEVGQLPVWSHFPVPRAALIAVRGAPHCGFGARMPHLPPTVGNAHRQRGIINEGTHRWGMPGRPCSHILQR